MAYVDGYILVIPKKNIAAYKKMAKEGAKAWIKHGALSYKECMGDDLHPDMDGHSILQFDKLMKLKPTETVWFSYIEYKSRKHRDQVNAKVMKEMEKQQEGNPDPMKDMPFDMKRMAFGGFSVEVSNS